MMREDSEVTTPSTPDPAAASVCENCMRCFVPGEECCGETPRSDWAAARLRAAFSSPRDLTVVNRLLIEPFIVAHCKHNHKKI
jgi:hypothetical protein